MPRNDDGWRGEKNGQSRSNRRRAGPGADRPGDRDVMDELAASSLTAYRGLVYDDPGFAGLVRRLVIFELDI